jgi:hypothetical protein
VKRYSVSHTLLYPVASGAKLGFGKRIQPIGLDAVVAPQTNGVPAARHALQRAVDLFDFSLMKVEKIAKEKFSLLFEAFLVQQSVPFELF